MSQSLNVNYQKYVFKERNSENSSLPKAGLLTLVLFALSGCPNTYNITDTLWLELPWFEESQPEGNFLASYLVQVQGVSAILVLGMLCIESYVIPFPKLGILYCSSFLTLITCIALVFGWSYSFDGISVFLLLGSAVGEIVGWVQYIFVIPWIAKNYNPRIISVFMSGDCLTTAMLVILQMLQQPGAAQNFSPTILYLVASNYYAITFGVCVFTFQSGIGRIVSANEIQTLKPWRSSVWTQTFPSMF